MSSAPLAPPLDWFNQPEPDHAEPLRVEADGRVHGHLAPWDGCHAGMVNGRGTSCVKPQPSRTGYRMFHLGELETAEGENLPVGKIVVDGSHASIQHPLPSLQAAAEHYDKTGSVAAFVRAHDGEHGIWLSGALRSDISPTQLRNFRANLPSGDWRNLDHNLELVGALSVPVPGYGIPAMVAAAESGEVEALILQGFEGDVVEAVRDRSLIRRTRMVRDEIEFDALTAATFSTKERQRLAKSGMAMTDGSFPIRNCSDWQNARESIGRTPPSRRPAVEAHIAKRGKALGCS